MCDTNTSHKSMVVEQARLREVFFRVANGCSVSMLQKTCEHIIIKLLLLIKKYEYLVTRLNTLYDRNKQVQV